MKTLLFVLLVFFSVSSNCFCQTDKNVYSVEEAKNSLKFAAAQYTNMMQSLPDSVFPRSYDSNKKQLVTSDYQWWCSGFFPGSLWFLYEYTKDDKFRAEAEKRTAFIEPMKNFTGHHDLGFMMYNSFGNGLRLTNNEKYKEILLTGAKSLCTRFNKKTGCIKSWDWTQWDYPVIIDNMMNLEFLFWASKVSGNEDIFNIAVTHANTTLRNHFRKDWSSYHVVLYDTATGKMIKGVTAQGYADESAWARGQAWGLYGFTMCYRETKDLKYLDAANNIAAYILGNPNLPEDKITYWDFNAPDIPNALRDVSASAIICSALLDLSTFVTDKELSERYMNTAETILASLSKPEYRAGLGENGNFILKHSVGSIPHKSEIDVALTYSDYYYIESLMRYLRLKKSL